MAKACEQDASTEGLEELVARELDPLFKLLLRMRARGVVPMALVAGWLAFEGQRWWKLGLALAVAAGLGALALRDRHKLERDHLGRAEIVALLASIMTVHLTLIAVTGGIRSPMLLVLPVVVMLMAIGGGRPRIVAMGLVLPFAVVWVLALLDLGGGASAVVPAVLTGGAGPPDAPALVVVLVSVVTLVMAVSATFGVALRRAFERAVQRATAARTALLEATLERNRELRALGGSIAHELKNPLAAVRGLAGLQARRVEPGTRQAEQARVLVEEVERMGSILEAFLNFSRPLTPLSVEAVAVERLLGDLVTLHGPLAEARGVTVDLRGGQVAALRGDPRKLRQVLINLVHNAIDASEPGATIELVARVDADAHVFEVLDRGSGLSSRLRGRLFTPGLTTKAAGSGLGLVVARALAEQHGGTLALHAREGGGCRAELRLPSAGPPPPEPRAA